MHKENVPFVSIRTKVINIQITVFKNLIKNLPYLVNSVNKIAWVLRSKSFGRQALINLKFATI